MRSIIKSFLLTSLFLSLAFSCSDDSSGGGGIPSVGNVSATIAGKSWVGTNGTGVIATQSTISSLIVAGTKVDIKNPTSSEVLSVVVYSAQGASLAVGDYNVNTETFPKGQITYTIGLGSGDNTWYATSGTVTITKITDTNFQGTFSGTLTKYNSTETKTLTDGGFNVNKSAY